MLLLKNTNHIYCTPLDLAHDHDHSQVVEFLLSKGAKVNNCSKVSMYTYVNIYV